MLDQMGPRRLLREFKAEAPHYAKLLPALPRLLHSYLNRQSAQQQQRESREWRELLKEQKRTNRLLQSLLYGGVGFSLGLLVMQWVVRVRIF